MENIQEIHELIYQRLIQKHNENNSFTFTTRLTNRFGRLDQGYWFHGNEYYLAVSLWTGTDWMNKTPNIYFCVNDEGCFLIISVFDSLNKKEFVERELLPKMELYVDGRYSKRYPNSNEGPRYIMAALEEFIMVDKEIIDGAIRKSQDLLSRDENKIGFIPLTTFKKITKKIEDYRRIRRAKALSQKLEELLEETPDDAELVRLVEKPYGIEKVEITNFLGLDNCIIDNIPVGTRCILLTGENGTGKTSILKAIGCALTNDHSRFNNQEYSVRLILSDGETDMPIAFSSGDENKEIDLQIDDHGYAAYGPYRMMTDHSSDDRAPDLADHNHSLFNPAPILYDIEKGINVLSDIGEIERQNRRTIIDAVIRDMIPGFRNFIWATENAPTKYVIGYAHSDEILEASESQFEVEKLTGNPEYEVTYDQLASGAKSIISMVGDMITRLFIQQPTISDLAELKGFVLIDEIDIHLHPIFQKSFVKQLTDNFPLIQFIITTHSPIPLLGAPKESVVYRVGRDVDMSVKVKRVDTYLEIVNSNPNLLLTSPIFGFKNLVSTGHQATDRINTEDTFDEFEFRQLLRDKLNRFLER